jgi:hypothetical protein
MARRARGRNCSALRPNIGARSFIPGSYLTIDRWASEDAFRAFRKDHDGDYETLDRSCDVLTSRETRIGAYTA